MTSDMTFEMTHDMTSEITYVITSDMTSYMTYDISSRKASPQINFPMALFKDSSGKCELYISIVTITSTRY